MMTVHSHPSHMSDNLALLAHETGLLVRTAAGLDDEAIRAASLCQGWSRAHVLSHLARNADALGNLVGWATTGTPAAMYESPTARDADIAAGSTRNAEEIIADLTESAARFASSVADLSGPALKAEVEMRAGRRVLGGQLPTLRLMEVVFHHVDLDAGYTFADADPRFVKRAIGNAVRRMRTNAGPESPMPAVSLNSDSGDTWSLTDDAQDVGTKEVGTREVGTRGVGSQVVTGTNAALLLWLARGDGTGVSSDVPLPRLPQWG